MTRLTSFPAPIRASLAVCLVAVGFGLSACSSDAGAGAATPCGAALCVGDAGQPLDGGGVDAAPVDAGAPGDGDVGTGVDGGACGDACMAASRVVDGSWLMDHLGEANLQVIDVRGEAAFTAAHIEGAVWLNTAPLRATVDGVAGQVPGNAAIQTHFRAAGLSRSATLVVYADATDTGASRVVWTLDHVGHADVRLLDGGLADWVAAGLATVSGAPAPVATDYTIDGGDSAVRVDADWVLARLDDMGVRLVDARSDGEFTAGHIPGALSVDWQRTVDAGHFRSRDQLDLLFAGIDRDATVIAYCQTGSRASVIYAVLRWLGFADVRLYDGSWAEWSARPDLPRAP